MIRSKIRSNSRRRLVTGLLVVVTSWLSPPVESAATEPALTVVGWLRNRVEGLVAMPTATTETVAESPAVGRVLGEPIRAREALPRFYEQRGFLPAWSRPPGGDLGQGRVTLSAEDRGRLAELLRELGALDAEGLEGEAYHLGPLGRLTRLGGLRKLTPAEQADLDLLASDAFLMVAAHRLGGQVNPETFEPEWRAVRREMDLVALLASALSEGKIGEKLVGLHPDQPAYGRLLGALATYRALEDWPVTEDGPALRPGDRGPRVAVLRRQLEVLEDLPGDLTGAGAAEGAVSAETPASPQADAAEPELFDPGLETALRTFQRRHGLDEDGTVGKQTLAALAITRSQRIRQIELNLERWRWLPRDLGERYVLVNLPAFRLVLVEGGQTVLELRAAVGREARRSPVLSDTLGYLVLNPAWEVPARLAVEDKLPEIRRDMGYLAREGFRVYSGWGSEQTEVDPATVDWATLGRGRFPYRLRQDPGPRNALGRIKFMFPNPYDVYIHDTPGREIFGRADRAVSSGCIRIEQPVELALLLLRDDASWTRETLLRAIDSGVTRTVTLPRPVPVHLQHWTAWVEDDGTVSFRADLYGRDARLDQALRRIDPDAVAD